MAYGASKHVTINKNIDVYGAKLLPKTILAYPVDWLWVYLCHLLNTQHCCLCPNEKLDLPLAAHLPHPPTLTYMCHSYMLYRSCEKVVLENQAYVYRWPSVLLQNPIEL